MLRRNQVLDKISSLEEEVCRLRERIPEDTNPQYNVWLAIIQKIKGSRNDIYQEMKFMLQANKSIITSSILF